MLVVLENDGLILRTGDMLAGLDLLERMRPHGSRSRAVIDTCRAERLLVLGDADDAVRLAKRTAFDSSAGKREQTVSLAILAAKGSKAMATRARDVLESLVARELNPEDADAPAGLRACSHRSFDLIGSLRRAGRFDASQRLWLPLAVACCAWGRGMEASCEACLLLLNADASSEAVCLWRGPCSTRRRGGPGRFCARTQDSRACTTQCGACWSNPRVLGRSIR